MSTNRLTLLTWNIWKDRFQLEKRLQAICEIIKSKNPDIICLQEVTSSVLYKLLRMEWVKYYFCNIKSLPKSTCGELILSKFPFKKTERFPLHYTSSDKHISIADVNLPINKIEIFEGDDNQQLCGHNLVIVNTQLEPLDMFSDSRKQQFYELVNLMMNDENVFILMDTNLTDAEGDSIDITDPWKDAYYEALNYLNYRNDVPSALTVDSDNNTLISGYAKFRYDRILFKSPYWEVSHFERIGDQPLIEDTSASNFYSSQSKPIFPSTHYGIYCEFTKVR